LPVDLGRADGVALKIGHFHERYRRAGLTGLPEFARVFAHATRGTHLCGNIISFDEERLRKLLRANGACPEWHYHIMDIEAMAIGWLKAQSPEADFSPPWKSDDLMDLLGLPPVDEAIRHTAMGDAEVVMNAYRVIHG